MNKHSNIKSFFRPVFIIVFLFSLFPVFSQNSMYRNIDTAEFIVTYTARFKIDSLNLDDIKTNEMWLFLGKNMSHFVDKSLYIDLQEMAKHKTREDVLAWAAKRGTPKFNFFYNVYKNYIKEEIIYTEKSLDAYFKYEENLDVFNWHLTQDTATICGYHTQKAICDYGGRSWIAWFSPEIPFNDGPYKFNGLPGLIVKIYDTRLHYCFELKYLEKAQNEFITMRNYHYLNTTKKNFFKAIQNFREDIISRIQAVGGSNHAQQVVAKNVAKRNNPIELKAE